MESGMSPVRGAITPSPFRGQEGQLHEHVHTGSSFTGTGHRGPWVFVLASVRAKKEHSTTQLHSDALLNNSVTLSVLSPGRCW